jgi:hypothetical protein
VNTHVLQPLAVNSKSEQKANSLSPLGFESVIFGMLAHLSAKSHPTCSTHHNSLKNVRHHFPPFHRSSIVQASCALFGKWCA